MLGPLLALFEAYAVARLVRSPLFNRMVAKAYRRINGLPPLEAENGHGRTGPRFLDHFKDEMKVQFRELTWQRKNNGLKGARQSNGKGRE